MADAFIRSVYKSSFHSDEESDSVASDNDVRGHLAANSRTAPVTEHVYDSRRGDLRYDRDAWITCSKEVQDDIIQVADRLEEGRQYHEAMSGITGEAQQITRQLGMYGARRGLSEPNFRHKDNKWYENDGSANVLRCAEWFRETRLEAIKVDRCDDPVPENNGLYTRFKPQHIPMWKDISASKLKTDTRLSTALATAVLMIDHDLQDEAGRLVRIGSMIVTEALIMNIEQVPPFSDKDTINAKIDDKFWFGMNMRETLAITAELSDGAMLMAYYRHSEKEMHELFELASDVYRDEQGLDGMKNPKMAEAGSFMLGNYNPLAPDVSICKGDEAAADWVLRAIQYVWPSYDVSGWQCAARWAMSMTPYLIKHGNSAESKQKLQWLTRWAFSRPTCRKLSMLPITHDATRDIMANDVTQAATAVVALTQQLHPMYVVLDDLEFEYKKGMQEEDSNIAAYWLQYAIGAGMTDIADAIPIKPKKDEGRLWSYGGFSANPDHETPFYIKVIDKGTGYTHTADCKKSEANAILYCFQEAHVNRCEEVISISGETVQLYGVHIHNGTAWYVMFMEGDLKGRANSLSYLISTAFREDEVREGLPLPELFTAFNETYKKTLSSEQRANMMVRLTTPVTTQQHHRHVSAIGVFASTGGYWAPVMDRVIQWPDTNATFMSTLQLAMANLPHHLSCLLQHWEGWNVVSMAEFAISAKAMSTKMKSLDNQVLVGNVNIDLAPLFEWETTLNRGTGEMSWSTEILERRDPSQLVNLTVEELKPEIDEFWRLVLKKVERADSGRRDDDKSVLYRTWEDFHKTRSIETPAGSAATVATNIKNAKNELKALGVENVNKTQVASLLPNDQKLDEYLDRPPMVIASKSIKFEWAKQRALFAAVYEHYAPTAFAYQSIEEYMPNDCPIGKAADASRVCGKVMDMSTNGVTCCIDAKNFNIMHKHEVMSYINTSYKNTFSTKISPEQTRALEWLAEAEYKQILLVRKDELTEEVYTTGTDEGWITRDDSMDTDMLAVTLTGGMYSGHRLTMLYNTILNRVYYKVAEKRARIKSRSLHSGDDVFSEFTCMADAFKLKKAFIEINYTLQLKKCFLASIVEFLRISHKNANTSQYLSRSCATALHGRVETSAATDYMALVSAHMRRGTEMIVRYGRRGVIMRLQMLQTAGASARWGVVAPTAAIMLQTPIFFGGIRSNVSVEARTLGFDVERSAIVKNDIIKKLSVTPGVKQAAVVLLDALQIRKYHSRAQSAIAAAIAPRDTLSAYGIRLRWLDTRTLERLAEVAGRAKFIKQSREYLISKATGLFNVLAREHEYWGDLTGIYKGVHPTWLGLMMTAALNNSSTVTELVMNNDFTRKLWLNRIIGAVNRERVP